MSALIWGGSLGFIEESPTPTASRDALDCRPLPPDDGSDCSIPCRGKASDVVVRPDELIDGRGPSEEPGDVTGTAPVEDDGDGQDEVETAENPEDASGRITDAPGGLDGRAGESADSASAKGRRPGDSAGGVRVISSTSQSASSTPGGKTSRPQIHAAVRRAITTSSGRSRLSAAARAVREAPFTGTTYAPGPTGMIESAAVRFQARLKPSMRTDGGRSGDHA